MSFTYTELAPMYREIRAVNTKKGWYPNDLNFEAKLALLHSEVSEALEAYRQWGLADATKTLPYMVDPATKPEGVGSELADVFIRLIDNADIIDGLNFLHIISWEWSGRFGMHDQFAISCNTLHDLISRWSMAIDTYLSCPLPDEIPLLNRCYRDVYQFLAQLAEFHGIDLRAEYQRKLAYNKTRAYRHGGKKL